MVLFKQYFSKYTYIIQICQFITESLFETIIIVEQEANLTNLLKDDV